MRVMAAEMRHVEGGVVSSHVPLLGVLRLRPHTLSDLAERHSVSAPTMSNTVTTLEERGWARRVRSDEDRRVVWIEITEQGLDILDRIERQVAARIADLLNDLTEEQCRMLVNGLTVLRDTFAKGVDSDPTL
jgi:MarR family transcriptional regulator, organic hydroperoxide resistance regulator